MYFLISIFIRLIFINIIDDAVAMHDGKNVEEGNFKFMVHIDSFFGDGYSSSCGGVVIDKFHIMTAAHCVECSEAQEISIFIGSVSVPASFFIHAVNEVYIHPNYTSQENCSASENSFTQDRSFRGLCLNFLTSCISRSAPQLPFVAAANDIAIMKLYISIPLGRDVTNVNLPDSESLPYCEPLNFASWYHPNSSSESIPLQFTEVELIFPEDCEILPPDDQFCASTMDRATRFGMVEIIISWQEFSPLKFDFQKYVSEGSTVRDCVENCVEKEVWSTRTYCCQNDGCNKAGPSLHAAITTLWMTSIALGIVAAGRLGG